MFRSPSLRFALCVASLGSIALANDPFAELVRPTDPLTPDQQKAAFHLPPGFEIQLVASEPDLRKPMNMQFDATGRLWVTESREYPFPAKADAVPRDTVRIFSDFDETGRARKVEIFADQLNIPIGLYPFRSASTPGAKPTWKCIVWSIPNIWLMEDTDGDGKADKRDVLYGPLGWERDTHGNLASFRRGLDGWLYGTHGFNNNTTFNARDGSSIKLNSGNTWRARIDGQRVEQWTWGQVNPFGLCWDDRGNLFSADCHSSPIYQLLRGAYYPSFGKPHDGLGFGPTTVTHSHGSTAICGPIYISDPAWPAEYQNHMLVCNPQTSRLNHDHIEWRGASSKGRELPDFLKTDDPWFRPVDLAWGPDGALYIADFYNKIIGHYEVPLNHPGRDRERGRLWRIIYRGEKAQEQLRRPALPEDVDGLVGELASGNPTRRTIALNELCDRIGAPAISAVAKAAAQPANAHQQVYTLWALHRLGALESNALLAAAKSDDPLVRTHAMRIADATPKWTPELTSTVRAALSDADAITRRTAAEALGSHPTTESIRPLLEALRQTPREDDHLAHSIRISLRDHFRSDDVARQVRLDGLATEELRPLLEVMLAVPGEQTALLRLNLFERLDPSIDVLAQQLPSLVKNVPADRLESVAALARRKLTGDLGAQATLVSNLLDVLDQRGAKAGAELHSWANALIPSLLSEGQTGWQSLPAPGLPPGKNPWGFQERKCADGTQHALMSSHTHGETLTGLIRSAPFKLPTKLRFYLCGHENEPGNSPGKKNFVRLVDAADGTVLREARVPRNDTAQRVEWDLSEFAGRSGRFEAIDSDNASAFAWLGFGRFKPELPELVLIEPGRASQRHLLGAELIRRFKLTEHKARVYPLLDQADLPSETRAAAAKALLATEPAAAIPRVVAALQSAPTATQTALAHAVATSREGATALIEAISSGKAAPALLRDKALADSVKAMGLADRVAAIVSTLPPANVEIEKAIAAKRATFDPVAASPERGAKVFTTHCGACHRIDGQGGLVGPQLDGIGSRGLDRILEDILDPNRNVDRAFRTSIVTLNDGNVIAGLVRREEGEQLVLADFTGKEQSIARSTIKSRAENDTSLMPPTLGDLIPPADFNDLLAYLLSVKAK